MIKNRWLANNYGSRRGFVRTYWHQCLYLFGRYHSYSQVDFTSVDRLVFICKGNICRSAYAEAIALSLGINAISCGIETIEDAPANADAISAAKQLGVDLKGHVTSPIMYQVLKKTDLLIAMEPWQVEFLQNNLARNYSCTLLGLWSRPRRPHIEDPYGLSSEYFEKCFLRIQSAVNGLAKRIK